MSVKHSAPKRPLPRPPARPAAGRLPDQVGSRPHGQPTQGARPATPATVERQRQARALLTKLRRIDKVLKANEQRMTEMVGQTGTTLTRVTGLGAVSVVTIVRALGSERARGSRRCRSIGAYPFGVDTLRSRTIGLGELGVEVDVEGSEALSEELKAEAARMYLEDPSATYSSVAKNLGATAETLRNWVKWHR